MTLASAAVAYVDPPDEPDLDRFQPVTDRPRCTGQWRAKWRDEDRRTRRDRHADPTHSFPPTATRRPAQVFMQTMSASAQPILAVGFGSLLIIAGLFIRAGVILSSSWADRCIAGTLTTPQRRTPLVAAPVGGVVVLIGVAELSPASVRIVPIVLVIACLAVGGLIWVKEPAWSQPKWMRTARVPAFTGSRATTIVWIAVIADLVGTMVWVILREGGSPYDLLPLVPFGLAGVFLGMSRLRRDH
jgi:hypothetical protein